MGPHSPCIWRTQIRRGEGMTNSHTMYGNCKGVTHVPRILQCKPVQEEKIKCIIIITGDRGFVHST